MKTPKKSTLTEIRERFDLDVERFANLEIGQAATVDAPVAMELITRAAIAVTPRIRRLLDIGCGAGNNTVKLLREYPGDFDCDLCDLSLPMLERARGRVAAETTGVVRIFQCDFREAGFANESYDVIIAAAVLHHLREEDEWVSAFRNVHEWLRPGGSFWITDLVSHEHEAIQGLMAERYGGYLEGVGGAEYRSKVFEYIEREDSPRSVSWQMELLRRAGFKTVDILRKNSFFAAFGGVKAAG